MKKLLTLFIVVCMIFSAIPMTVSAGDHVETPNASTIPAAPVADPSNPTVYVSGTGEDTDSGTEASPVKTLTKAYELATVDANNGKDVNICVLNDGVSITNLTDFGDHDGTVYIYGVGRTVEGEIVYPTVSGPKATSFIVLGADTVFYNINFNNGSNTLVISAAFHKLIFGNDFSGGSVCKVTGGVYETGAEKGNGNNNIHTENGAVLNGACIDVYSGSFDEFHATWRDNLPITTTNILVDKPCVINIYGEDVSIRLLQDVSATQKANLTSRVTFNIFGGTVTTFRAQHTRCLTDLYKANSANVTKGVVSGLLNEYNLFTEGEAKYCGIQTGTYEGKNAVRFVGTVDSLDYDSVGLQIITGDGYDFTTSCKTVYTKILGEDNSNDYEYTTDDLGGEGIFAVIIKGIPSGTVTFDVRPFYTQDGVDYYGLRYTVTIKDGAFVSSVIN